MKKVIMVGTLVSILSLGMIGTVLAGEVGTEAGADIISTSKALEAAALYQYDYDRLAQLATEAGADIISTPKALEAAANYKYDPIMVQLVSTEAGVSI